MLSGRALPLLWPTASVVIDAQNFQHGVAYAIGNDKEFACAGHATGVSELRILRKQLFDAMQKVHGGTLSCRGIVDGNVRAQRNRIVDGFGRPRELHAALGFRCSLRVSPNQPIA